MGRATARAVGMLVVVLVAASATAARAGTDGRRGVYLTAAAGFGLTGSVGVLNRSRLDAPEVLLGVHHRWRYVDVGVQLGYLFSGRFADPFEPTRPHYGGQATLAVTGRWRFANPDWGAVFTQLDLGAMLLEHTPRARGAFRDLSGRAPDGLRAPGFQHGTFTAGFTLAGSFGLLFHIASGVDGTLQLRTLLGVSNVTSPVSGELDYVVTGIVLSMGVEFGL